MASSFDGSLAASDLVDSTSSHSKKKKKSKLEKIYELQAQKKQLQEENKVLKRRVQQTLSSSHSHHHGPPPMVPCDASTMTSTTQEKLQETVKSLKRVTVKQEQSLAELRAKIDEKRRLIEARDKKIAELTHEVEHLKKQRRRQSNQESSSAPVSDIDKLRLQVQDLELSFTEHENRNRMLSLQLEASEEHVKKLQKQYESARGLMNKQSSHRSLRSSDTSSSEQDIARLKRELANKIERIVLLEFDLEMTKEELHELKEKHILQGTYYSADQEDEEDDGTQERSYFDDDDASDLT